MVLKIEHVEQASLAIDDANSGVPAAFQIADDRQPIELLRLIIQALIGAEMALIEPAFPVKIIPLRVEEMSREKLHIGRLELDLEAADERAIKIIRGGFLSHNELGRASSRERM